jgi:hypothetical protein
LTSVSVIRGTTPKKLSLTGCGEAEGGGSERVTLGEAEGEGVTV